MLFTNECTVLYNATNINTNDLNSHSVIEEHLSLDQKPKLNSYEM